MHKVSFNVQYYLAFTELEDLQLEDQGDVYLPSRVVSLLTQFDIWASIMEFSEQVQNSDLKYLLLCLQLEKQTRLLMNLQAKRLVSA